MSVWIRGDFVTTRCNLLRKVNSNLTLYLLYVYLYAVCIVCSLYFNIPIFPNFLQYKIITILLFVLFCKLCFYLSIMGVSEGLSYLAYSTDGEVHPHFTRTVSHRLLNRRLLGPVKSSGDCVKRHQLLTNRTTVKQHFVLKPLYFRLVHGG